MPGRTPFVALGLMASLALASCDTLKARRTANEAAGLYKDGKLVEAAALYTEAEKLDPRISAIHLNLAFTYVSLFSNAPKGPDAQKWAGLAVEELKEYLRVRPDDPRGRQYLLQIFVDARRYDDAVEFFKPEVERNPPSLEAISLLGQIAAKVGKFDESLGWYQKRVDLMPKDADARIGLGQLIWDHLRNHPSVAGEARIALADRGIAELKKAIELNPFPPLAYTYTNLLYRERSTGHQCPTQTDGGLAETGAMPTDGGLGDGGVAACVELVRADLLEAERYYKIAMEKVKAGAVNAPATPAPPAKPGAPSPGGKK